MHSFTATAIRNSIGKNFCEDLKMNTAPARNLKLTVVGDGDVGKTCLVNSYTNGAFPEGYVPIVLELNTRKQNVDGVDFHMSIWDTESEEQYEKLRPLSYSDTDCFIVCYAVNDRSSFANVESKWMPELSQCCPKTACILVGTKCDIKMEAKDSISFREGKKLKSKIKAQSFMECSAKTRENLEEVFVEAIRATMKNPDKISNCNFL